MLRKYIFNYVKLVVKLVEAEIQIFIYGCLSHGQFVFT
jgi:hypothetical protein